jgi:hypothetical protein
MSRHRCLALRAAARAIASGALTAKTLEGLPSPVALARLMELPGIGLWSAALILLRGLRRVDVFPQADTGAESSLITLMHLRSRASLERVVERFNEHRGYLYFYGLASRLLASGLIQAPLRRSRQLAIERWPAGPAAMRWWALSVKSDGEGRQHPRRAAISNGIFQPEWT